MLASTSEGPRLGDSENNGNHVESASGTSTSAWYKGGIHSVSGRHSLYRQSKPQHAGWLESIDSTTATNAHMGPRKEGNEGYAKDT